MQFTKATRKKAKLRLALSGPSGSGKTFSALLLAKGIGGKTAVIDTERDSASLYSNVMDFDSLNLEAPYSPERFIQAIKAAERAGYDTLIIDSLSHEWSGVGGCLELVDEVARAKYRGNSWSAWNEVTPRHRALLDAILQCPMHIIATTRAKTETAQTEENGRKKVVKLGMKSEQRDGLEYEFTIALDLVHDGNFAVASKDRTGLFTQRDPQPITEDTGRELLSWLESGAEQNKAQPDASYSSELIKSLEHAASVSLVALGDAWKALSAQDRKLIGADKLAELKEKAKPLTGKLAAASSLDALYALADIEREMTQEERAAFEQRQKELEG